MKRLIMLGLLMIFFGNAYAQDTINFFISPNPVCIGDSVTIINDAPGYNSYYWSFCAASPFDLPSVDALDLDPGTLSEPVFIALAHQDEDYYAFIVNHSGYITRIHFGSDILNPNPEVDNIDGMLPAISEGIQIVEDNEMWYAFVVGGKSDPNGNNTAFFRRLDFGNSLSNTPTYTELDTEGKLFFPHDLYIFKDEVEDLWWGMTVNNGLISGPDVLDGSVTRFAFFGGIESNPVVENLGNFDLFKDPVGIFPIKEENNWYVFVTDRYTGLVRLEFGNSLTLPPIADTVSTDNVLTRPRDISLLRYCDQIVGFVVDGEQHNNSHLVRLDFADGLDSSPVAEKLTELGNYFSFPHSISDLLRSEDQTFAMVTNVGLNNIARVFFPSCEDEIPAQVMSEFGNPDPVAYFSPGVYNIELIVNLGEPDQDNVCQEITVNLPTAELELLDDTIICKGDQAQIQVHFTGYPPWNFSYSDGLQTWNHQSVYNNPFTLFVTPEVTSSFHITSVGDNLCPGESAGSPVTVQVTPKDDAGFDYASRAFCKNIGVIEPVFVNLEGGIFSVHPPGLDIDPQTGVIMLYPETVTGEYNIIHSVAAVCPNSDTIQLNIQDAIFADFFYTQAGYCQNDPDPVALPGDESDIGSLSFYPDGLVLDTVSGGIDLSASIPGTYWIINEILEAAGCPYEIDSTQVEIYHLPVPEFTSDTVCLGDSTSLFDLSTIAEGEIVERIWYYDDVEIGRGFETQFAFPEPPGLHNITLEVVSNTGCITDTVMTAFVKALPEIDLLSNIPAHQISDTVISVCLFESITLDASNPDNPDNIAYLWATGDTTATLTVGAYGIGYEMQYHYVTVTDNVTGCMDTKEIYVEFSIAACVGIDDFNPLKGIKLFPNPAFDIVQVQSDESIHDLWLGLYNVHGVLIENFYLPELSSNNPFNILVSELPQGLYVLILRNNDVVSSVKMMIAR
jgi:hypothetical protein